MRQIISLVVGFHGWVHVVLWAIPFSEEALADLPMDPGHSWLLGDARGVGLGLGIVTALVFVAAAVGIWIDAGWWPHVGIVAAGLGIVLMTLFFSPWWALGYVIDAALIVAATKTL